MILLSRGTLIVERPRARIARRGLITGGAALVASTALIRPARAAGWTLVASNQGAGQNSPVTPSMNMTSADLIVISANWTSGANPTLQDSGGNSYTNIITLTNPSSFKTGFWYIHAPNVSSSMTFTLSGVNVYGNIIVQGWSGSVTGPLDQSNNSVSWTGNTITPGSITPVQANELVVTCVGSNDPGGAGWGYTINGGYTVPGNNSVQQTGSNYGGSMAYLLQTIAAATNPTWTDALSVNGLSTAIASFRQTAGGSVQRNALFFHGVP